MIKDSKQATRVTITNESGLWCFSTKLMFSDAAAVMDNLSKYMDGFAINDKDPKDIKVIVHDDYMPELVTIEEMLNIELARNGLVEFKNVFNKDAKLTSSKISSGIEKDDQSSLDHMNYISDIINLAKESMPSERDPYSFDKEDIRYGWHYVDCNDEDPEIVEVSNSPRKVEPIDDAIEDIDKQADEAIQDHSEEKEKIYMLNLLEYAKYMDQDDDSIPKEAWDDVDTIKNWYGSVLDNKPIGEEEDQKDSPEDNSMTLPIFGDSPSVGGKHSPRTMQEAIDDFYRNEPENPVDYTDDFDDDESYFDSYLTEEADSSDYHGLSYGSDGWIYYQPSREELEDEPTREEIEEAYNSGLLGNFGAPDDDSDDEEDEKNGKK